MQRHATLFAADPARTYRSVDLAARAGGSDPHQLVGLLYEEAVAALRSVAWAAERREYKLKGERLTRAIAILFALEANLDFERGGEVSRTLATLYRGLREEVVAASVGHDPAPFRRAADSLSDIAEAWASVRG